MKFKGGIIITDPCYVIKDKDSAKFYDAYIKVLPKKLVVSDAVKIFKTSYNAMKCMECSRHSIKNVVSKLWKIRHNKQEIADTKYPAIFRLKNMDILASDTLYGDWSCITFDLDTKQPIGRFCADGGMVAVFNLDEVLKYNPKFDYHITKPHTTTLIKDFDGEVEIKYNEKREEVYVCGNGNINFITQQTGF